MKIEIFYDIISPYSYLGLELFNRSSLKDKFEIVTTPVLLGVILGATENPGPANIPSKRRVALYDVCLQCKRFDVPFVGPPGHPFIPLAAARFIHSIENQQLRFETALQVNRLCWADSKAMDTEEKITAGLKDKHPNFQPEWEDISALIKENNGRKLLKSATARALELDIFGVPTFRYDEVNFWGSDRLDLLEDYIENPDKYKETSYQRMLNLPSGM